MNENGTFSSTEENVNNEMTYSSTICAMEYETDNDGKITPDPNAVVSMNGLEENDESMSISVVTVSKVELDKKSAEMHEEEIKAIKEKLENGDYLDEESLSKLSDVDKSKTRTGTDEKGADTQVI